MAVKTLHPGEWEQLAVIRKLYGRQWQMYEKKNT